MSATPGPLDFCIDFDAFCIPQRHQRPCGRRIAEVVSCLLNFCARTREKITRPGRFPYLSVSLWKIIVPFARARNR